MSTLVDGEVRLRYIDVDGRAHELRASVGETLMQVATANRVRGVEGDCGGICACGTCLIGIDEKIANHLDPPGKDERGLLAFLGRNEHSYRLGCQIRLSAEMNDFTATVPKS